MNKRIFYVGRLGFASDDSVAENETSGITKLEIDPQDEWDWDIEVDESILKQDPKFLTEYLAEFIDVEET